MHCTGACTAYVPCCHSHANIRNHTDPFAQPMQWQHALAEHSAQTYRRDNNNLADATAACAMLRGIAQLRPSWQSCHASPEEGVGPVSGPTPFRGRLRTLHALRVHDRAGLF
jgi:hypothetical protein